MADRPAGSGDSFLDRFPALLGLGRGQARRVPLVKQMSITECGAACVAMVLGYHGKPVRLDEVREVLGVDRDGWLQWVETLHPLCGAGGGGECGTQGH